MTRTRRKKRFAKERKICNPEGICLKCDGSMKNASHHYFCNDCYTQGLMYSEEIQRKIKEREVKKLILKESYILKQEGEIAITTIYSDHVIYAVKKGDELILKEAKLEDTK